MKIYHYTHYFLKDRILNEGLMPITDEQHIDYGTKVIWKIINQYKPSGLPPYIDRSYCTFFKFEKNLDYFGFEVETEKLDPQRLYVFDYQIAQKIYDEAICCATIDECRGEIFESLSKKYWKSMTPFYLFNIDNETTEDKEVIYFSEIPPNFLEVIFNDEDRKYIELYSLFQKYYDVEKIDFLEFTLKNSKNKIRFTYLPSKGILHVTFSEDLDIEVLKTSKLICKKIGLILDTLVLSIYGDKKVDYDIVTGKIIWTPVKIRIY